MLFLHISDIHFRETHVGQPDDPNRALRDDLVRDVKTTRKRIGHHAQGILLSGDIAYAGKPIEYAFAMGWLEKELCPAAGCKLTDVFVIPGNHDVDRDAAKAPAQNAARQALRNMPANAVEAEIAKYMRDQLSSEVIFGPLESYNRFAANFLCHLGPYINVPGREPARPFAVRNLRLNDGSILRLWGFNSVLTSNSSDEEENMLVDPAAAQIVREDGVSHLIMCHHPFNWLKNGVPFQNRIEAVAQVHLFGHEHTRRVETHADFVRVRAGAIQPDRDEPGWRPGYNWIDIAIDGAGDKRSLKVRIWVRAYETHPPQFLGVPDNWGKDPWESNLPLEPWYPAVKAGEPIQDDGGPLAVLDQTVDPTNPPPLDVRNVALKIMKLRVDQQERLMQSLGLSEPGDRVLKDYELGTAALRRSVERNRLAELDAALTEALSAEGKV